MWPFRKSRSPVADDVDGPTEDAFGHALDDAEELLKYAAEVGKIVPPGVILSILSARTALAAGGADQGVRSDFYSAFTQLSSICGEVTARTIRYCSAPNTWKALARNRIMAVSLTLFIAAVSVATFVTDDMSNKILAAMVSANADAAKLRAGLTEGEGDASRIDVRYAQKDPCELTTTPPETHDRTIRNVDDVTKVQQFAATTRDLLGRSLKLNRVIASFECDPFSMQHCGDPSHDKQKPDEVDLNKRLQINPAIVNYTAEVLCKIATYQRVRSFASNVQGDYSAIIGAIAAFALPILYAWLGAFAYRLRSFGDTIRRKTYHPSFADSARMITAVIAGAIVGLFNPGQGITLSPLATAFLVGYGVELFFRFLDTLINFGAPPAQSGSTVIVRP